MQRQYDAVDPDNRLVAGELERRWNEALATVKTIEDELEGLSRRQPDAISDDERQSLMTMGADMAIAWEHPRATAATRKRILRAVLEEIVVRVESDQIVMLLHWRGGDHTALNVKKNKKGHHRWAAEPATEDLIRALARLMPDKAMAALLNREGFKTGRLNGWTQSRVCTFRSQHSIAVYQEGERAARGEITLDEAAGLIGCSAMSVRRMVRDGILAGNQHCKGAPWIIRRADVEVIAAGKPAVSCRKRPSSQNPDQAIIQFQ
ncbi:helix-turn-helix domain-containing protein [Aurantimonas marianensis]|uniref:Helix-turn-helix domain-containing protein n=1 Tax=Aurantimonas marianensis TaxID=2920428 RepID=A0A9X2H9W0_9HYPH|nr:helix-turn-helix domain-containing protein [Aurantimonas marianensis]MCP3056911.1 helix-turn-helix domain-containing protein [Aurantimonas marianensis]